MRKIVFLLLTSVFMMHLIVSTSFAQHQRLGISPQEIILNENSTKTVSAYCFDRHVLIDGSYDYGNLHTDNSAIKVIAGYKTYSFAQAINQKIIKVTGRPGNVNNGEPRLVIEFTKLVSYPVSIKVESTSVFSDVPGKYSNKKALDIIDGVSAQNDLAIQDAIWGADIDRARLESLGFNSIKDFQKRFGLAENDTFDSPTKLKLQEVEEKLRNGFENIFLYASPRDTKIKLVSDNIQRLQRLYGKPLIGGYSSEVESLLRAYSGEHLPVIREQIFLSSVSGFYVNKLKSSIGGQELYTFYTPFGVYKEDISFINRSLSNLSKTREVYLDLEFPSIEKIEAVKFSLNNESATFITGDENAKKAFFSIGEIKSATSSPVVKENNSYNSILTYKTAESTINEKMTVSARVKETVVGFVSSFKQLINGKRRLSSIVSEARRRSGSVTVGVSEFGKMRIIKLLPKKTIEVITE